jgi:hypothetical protein
MSTHPRQRRSGQGRLSLDSKVLEQSGSKKGIMPKDNPLLFTRLQSYFGSPKAAMLKHSSSSPRTLRTLGDSKSARDPNKLSHEVHSFKDRYQDQSETCALQVKVLEAIETLHQVLNATLTENARLKAERKHIEAACKEVCFLLTANAIAANQKAIGRLRTVLSAPLSAVSSTSRSTPHLMLDEVPRLDENIRLKSKTSSNRSLGKRPMRSPYHSSPGEITSKIRRIKSPLNLGLASVRKARPRSRSLGRSPSPLDLMDTQSKLQFIKEKTRALLKSLIRRS